MGKKRVVFVTWGGGYNFGGCFQSYALLMKLQDLGYDVRHLAGIRIARTVKERIKLLAERIGVYDLYVRLRCRESLLDRKIRKWADAYPRVCIRTNAEMRRLLQETDCFISGSDQIWNTYHQFSPFFFLDFAEGRKRISYASSIGTMDVNPAFSEKVRNLLLGYAHIGVRELTGVEALRKLTGREDVVQVVDPSFLLTREEWREIGKEGMLEFVLPSRYILCYVLGQNPDYEKWLGEIKSQLGINDVIVLPAKYDNPDFAPQGSFVYQNAGPREFIKLLDGAEVVVTDSFHATAFCLNFLKPFVEFMRFHDNDSKSQNSRIYDMIGRFSMQNRIYKGGGTLRRTAFSDVEKERISAWCQSERRRCTDWLRNAIEA